MARNLSYSGGFTEHDEYVPMVDKAVDPTWKKEVSHQKLFSHEGCDSDVKRCKNLLFIDPFFPPLQHENGPCISVRAPQTFPEIDSGYTYLFAFL